MIETIIRSDFATWGELDENDRSVIRERIAEGELPSDFRVTRHRYYVGPRARHHYLEPTAIPAWRRRDRQLR
jgi:hypothetical protein